MMPRLIVAIAALFGAWSAANAQHEVAIKTNLLYDATATINLGVEVPVAPKWSIDLSGNLNDWKIRQRQWKHWLIQPEARYFLCNRMNGHFFAAHLLGGQYSVGNLIHIPGIGHLPDFLGTSLSSLNDTRVKGWFAGAGVGYGYTWVLGKHWNVEAEVAIGWAYTRYDRYDCKTGKKTEDNHVHNYVGPTKLAVNVAYVF